MSQFFDILTDRKTERQKDRQTDRRTDGQAEVILSDIRAMQGSEMIGKLYSINNSTNEMI